MVQATVIRILPGQYHATGENTVISTVLGSCVSVCLYDPVMKIGGMNHFMLPGVAHSRGASKTGSAKYGIYAMTLLLDHVIQLGARKTNLAAKIFGAGRVMDGMSDVGCQNSDFAIRFVRDADISIAAIDVGDIYPRKIYFYPATGRVFVKRIQHQALSPDLFEMLLVSAGS